MREGLEFECWRSSYTGVSSVQCSHGARWGRRGRVAYAPRSGGDGRERVEAAEERRRRAWGVDEGGLWPAVEHGTGGLLELGGGGGGRERGNQVGHSRNGPAMLVRKGRAITLLLVPAAPAAPSPPTAIPRMSQAACIQTYIQFLSRFSGRSRTLLHSLSGQSLSIIQPSHGLSSLERSHRNRDPSQPSIQQQRKFGESFERRAAQSPASRGPSIHFRKKRDQVIES